MTLYPHNQKAYEAVMKHFGEGNRKAAIIQPTGSGKSYAAGAVAAHFKKVLVVAPNEYVLEQATSTVPHADTATYSLISIREEMPSGYDLIWFDEFHRIGAPTWHSGVDKIINANPQAKILGTTATPDRSLEQRNMADEFFEGDVVSSITLTDAWVNHILRVPKYVIGVISMDSTEADYTKKINASTRIGETQKKEATAHLNNIIRDWSCSYGVPRILHKYLDKDVERMIVFAQTIKKLDEVVSSIRPWFNEAGIKLANVYSVHSGMGSEAKTQMEAFENDKTDGVKVLVSVDMLNEGIHVERVDAVMLLRSTISKNLYMQQIGRCFAVGQKHQPIILDLADNLTSACGYDGIFNAQRKYIEYTSLDKNERTPDVFMVIDTLKDTRELIAKRDAKLSLRSWSYDSCKEEALKYKTRSDFMKGCGSAYKYAHRNGFLDEICSHMTEKLHRWTKEECQTIALKYTKRTDFRKYDLAAYHFAEKNKFLHDICSHMEIVRCQWTKEKVLSVAKECKTRKAFATKYSGAYTYALCNNMKDELDKLFGIQKRKETDKKKVRKRITYTLEECVELAKKYNERKRFKAENMSLYRYILSKGWSDIVLSHMPQRTQWTLELATEVASKYDNLYDFQKEQGGCYTWLRKTGYGDDVCRHMTKRFEKRNKDDVFAIAKQYDSLKKFRQNEKSAYSWLHKHHCVNEACEHMTDNIKRWDKESVLEEAKKYSRRKDFNDNASGAYGFALRNGILDEVCSHMVSAVNHWTLDECKKIALRYKTRVSMKKAEPKAYDAIISHKWGIDCFGHMIAGKIKYLTKEDCINKAKKYNKRSEFARKEQYCYRLAQQNGWLEECLSYITLNK